MTDQAYDKQLDAAIHARARARWLERSAVFAKRDAAAILTTNDFPERDDRTERATKAVNLGHPHRQP